MNELRTAADAVATKIEKILLNPGREIIGIVGAYELYEHWDAIKGFFKEWGAVLSALRRTAAAVAIAAPIIAGPAAAAMAPMMPRSGGTEIHIHINASPTLNVLGNVSPETEKSFSRLLAEHRRQLVDQVNAELER